MFNRIYVIGSGANVFCYFIFYFERKKQKSNFVVKLHAGNHLN